MKRGGFMDSFYSRGYNAGEWGTVYIPDFKNKREEKEYWEGYRAGFKEREKRYKRHETKNN